MKVYVLDEFHPAGVDWLKAMQRSSSGATRGAPAGTRTRRR